MSERSRPALTRFGVAFQNSNHEVAPSVSVATPAEGVLSLSLSRSPCRARNHLCVFGNLPPARTPLRQSGPKSRGQSVCLCACLQRLPGGVCGGGSLCSISASIRVDTGGLSKGYRRSDDTLWDWPFWIFSVKKGSLSIGIQNARAQALGGVRSDHGRVRTHLRDPSCSGVSSKTRPSVVSSHILANSVALPRTRSSVILKPRHSHHPVSFTNGILNRYLLGTWPIGDGDSPQRPDESDLPF